MPEEYGDVGMIEVYYYLPSEKVEYAVECGLKLSEWAQREHFINGGPKKCLLALLHPKDDMSKFKSDKLACVKILVDNKYCFVADKYLYDAGLESADFMEAYDKSIIPAEDYVFGTYRLPEVLIISTIVGGKIIILNKKMDSPFLYANSEGLYIDNLIESIGLKYDDFKNNSLYLLFDKLSADSARFQRMTDSKNSMTIFKDLKSGKVFPIKNPKEEMSKWEI